MYIINLFIAVFAKYSLAVETEEGDIFDNKYDDVHLWI